MGGIFKSIQVEQILNYYENPRHTVGVNEIDTLQKLFNAVGVQYMFNLAEDIQKHKLLPNQQMVVVYSEVLKKYVVYEGNRRLAVIKLLLDPESFVFLEANDINRAKKIADKGFSLREIPCYVTDEEEAFFIMERIHSGEDKGRGVKEWSSREKDEFKVRRNHQKTMSYLINVYMKKYFDGYDITTTLHFTTVQRIFNNRRIKREIGLDVNDESTFTKDRMMLIKEAAIWIKGESESSGVAVTRLFNKSDTIENKLLPWIQNYKSEDKNLNEFAAQEKNPDRLEKSNDSKNDYKVKDLSVDLSHEIDKNDSLSIKTINYEEQNKQVPIKKPGKIAVRKIHGLSFAQDEVRVLNKIKDKNDLSAKIYQLAYEISTLDIKNFYCSICGLYRAIIECSVRYYFKEQETKKTFVENSLESNVVTILNELAQRKGMDKWVKMWREAISTRKLLDTLNQYMHNESDIDLDFIEQTWKTMKSFIMLCIGAHKMN